MKQKKRVREGSREIGERKQNILLTLNFRKKKLKKKHQFLLLYFLFFFFFLYFHLLKLVDNQ